jgi:large subunit ribosomal protein L10
LASLEQKKAAVEDIKQRFINAKSVIFADYLGLTVKEFTILRTQLRKAGVELKIYKNTLVKRAVDQVGAEGVVPYLAGTNMWAFSMEDPVAAAKILWDFSKTHPKLILKGGVIDNKTFDAEGAKVLADLPSKEVLLAQLAGTMLAPITGLVTVLQGPIRKMGFALEAVRKSKEA